MMTTNAFHELSSNLPLPTQLNNPFSYEPHPLCLMAAQEVCRHLEQSPLHDEVMAGKMLGVLVCQRADGRVGFLAAYSGQLGGREDWPWFVPAVFDYLQPDGYFKREEGAITLINRQIASLEQATEHRQAQAELQRLRRQGEAEIAEYRLLMGEAKERRDALRQTGGHDDEALIRESQYQKAELRRLKHRWQEQTALAEAVLKPLDEAISTLKAERSRRSDALQRWLFDHFVMLNDRGEQRTLTDIFAHTPQHTPPAGAGECCAPKLLQHAYQHCLRPLAMAEFWQGPSPRAEVRHHGHYYPACRGKCKPILEWMISSLTPSRPTPDPSLKGEGSIYFQGGSDAAGLYTPLSFQGGAGGGSVGSFLVLTKPSGLLSVPGLTGEKSVESLLRRQYGEVWMVHRLDQDTSGLMVVALTAEAYHALQRQFLQRTVHKRYVALLSGTVSGSGTISLPLRPDPLDRPRQVVDHEHGREAVTRYEVLGHDDQGRTRIALTPLTGRTHQLRMHCAHAEGLATPIVGDRLYGHADGPRLMLHAADLSFSHPLTGQPLTFHSEPPF